MRLRSLFSLNEKLNDISAIESRMSNSSFWSNPTSAQALIQELKSIKSITEPHITLRSSILDDIELINMSNDDADMALIVDTKNRICDYEKRLQELEIKTFFTKDADTHNALLSIHSGAGGVDSMDWAEQLERMYQRWLTKSGFEWSIEDRTEGEAGIKRSVIEVRGLYAYGYLKSEIGVHRICHISEFDANHKKQTSFASVDVIPIYEETVIALSENDIEIDTFCSGGPGGQNVNKVASAVRLTHMPTNTVVVCQSQRSQLQNKKTAMRLLASKLKNLEDDKRKQDVANQYDNKTEISFGHQIRTYVTEPYQIVTDHRTDYKISNVQKVLDGDLTPLIEAYLRTSKI
jgi:peptide chain release factor 2